MEEETKEEMEDTEICNNEGETLHDSVDAVIEEERETDEATARIPSKVVNNSNKSSVLCEYCGKNVDSDNYQMHVDYHYAFELNQTINKHHNVLQETTNIGEPRLQKTQKRISDFFNLNAKRVKIGDNEDSENNPVPSNKGLPLSHLNKAYRDHDHTTQRSLTGSIYDGTLRDRNHNSLSESVPIDLCSDVNTTAEDIIEISDTEDSSTIRGIRNSSTMNATVIDVQDDSFNGQDETRIHCEICNKFINCSEAQVHFDSHEKRKLNSTGGVLDVTPQCSAISIDDYDDYDDYYDEEAEEEEDEDDDEEPNYGYIPNSRKMNNKTLQLYKNERVDIVDALQRLHNSLENCPAEEEVTSDPVGLKVPLLQHQKEALSWFLWRETEKPSGGILADDMGLGKTLEMISLIMKSSEFKSEAAYFTGERRSADEQYNGGTLIVCPASLLGQWDSEIKEKVEPGLLKVHVYHGQNKNKSEKWLKRLDVVITSYSTVRVEDGYTDLSRKPLFLIRWKRVILDEAHVIRNHTSRTSMAVCRLSSVSRWALTGTPVHNKYQDFYALLKFIRSSPFDQVAIWRRWILKKCSMSKKRLNTLTKSLMLRRTKEALISEKKLSSLPEKTSKCVVITLNKEEQQLYQEVLNFSQSLLYKFIQQKAETENLPMYDRRVAFKKSSVSNPFLGHPILEVLWEKANRRENIKTYEILVLLLRLRQICCHPSLIRSMVEKEALEQNGFHDTDLELLESTPVITNLDVEGASSSTSSNVFTPDNPIFDSGRNSSKVEAIINIINENSMRTTEDKVVIVSQWPTMLDLLHKALLKSGWRREEMGFITGKVPVEERMEVVNRFNNSRHPKVMLLSLTAGGTGLNLIGGNNLIITEPHWNPQLESQACDRIYRFGQKKPVNMYKIICAETIEEQIKALQQKKLGIADSVLTGNENSHSSRLTFNDLKMLFNVS